MITDVLIKNLINILKAKLDVYKDPHANILHLHKKSDNETCFLIPIIGSPIGADFFGLYVLQSTDKHFWGPSRPIFQKLNGSYADNWAMILLDGDPVVGYFYTPQNVNNSLSGWSTGISGDDFKIRESNLCHCRRFFHMEQLFGLLRQSGLPLE